MVVFVHLLLVYRRMISLHDITCTISLVRKTYLLDKKWIRFVNLPLVFSVK